MGLIKATVGAIGSTLGDQWKEVIKCEDMTNDVLMVKKTTKNGVISNGSTIIVGPGQCAIIYDNGKVIDATAEDGVYVFDESSTPSFFAGQFGEVFKEMWSRFTYEGASASQQAVFFFNTKEIINNPFGTSNPIPFQDWSHAIPNRMTNTLTPLSVKIKCFGTYVFKIVNPALFMKEISGTANIYKKDILVEQIRSEVMATFQNVVNELGNSKHKVPVLEMPSQTDEIQQIMNEKVYDEKIREKGLEITTFSVESVTLDDDSERKIEEYEHNSNAYMQQGRVLNVMQSAAENPNGSANGFMGVGMMNMASNGMGSSVMNNAFEGDSNSQINQNVQTNSNENNSQNNAGANKFCTNCGNKLPDGSKFCPNCGAKV